MESLHPKLVWQGMDAVSKLGGRVRYSCLDASQSLIVFGANTGTLYFYERESLRQVTLIPSKEIREPISIVKLNPNGSLLALSTSKGFLFILEFNLVNKKEKDKILLKISQKENICCLCWSEDGSTLFFSDEGGTTSMICLSKSKTPEVVHKDSSPIVQICCKENELLISSMTRCFVVNLQKQSCAPVGTQARDGKFGGCFHPNPDLPKRLLAARPGKRIWLADTVSGGVLQTLNLKDSLNQPPTPLLPISQTPGTSVDAIFSKLSPLSNDLILAWDENALFLIDLKSIRILQWHNDINHIQDLAIYQNDIYVIHGATKNQVSQLSLYPYNTAFNNNNNNIISPEIIETPIPQVIPIETPIITQQQQPEVFHAREPEPIREIHIPRQTQLIQQQQQIQQQQIQQQQIQQQPQQQIQQQQPQEFSVQGVMPAIIQDNTNKHFAPAAAAVDAIEYQPKKIKPKKGKSKRKLTNIVQIASPASPIVLPFADPNLGTPTAVHAPISLANSGNAVPSPIITHNAPAPIATSTGTTPPEETSIWSPSLNLSGHKSMVENLTKKTQGIKEKFTTFASRTNSLENQLSALITKIPEKVSLKSSSSKVGLAEEVKTSPLYTATRNLFGTLSDQGHDKRSKVLIVSIEEWLETYSANQEDAQAIPQDWIKEIITTYFELKLKRDRDHWEREKQEAFITTYFPLLLLQRIYSVCNRFGASQLISFIYQLDQDYADETQKTFVSLLDEYLSNNDALGALSIIKRKNDLGLVLKYIHRIFTLNPKELIDYCVDCYPNIQPANVEFVRQSHPQLYLLYLTQIIRNHPECKMNTNLVETWFELNLMDGAPPSSELYNNQNLPKLNAYQHYWAHSQILDEVIANPKLYSYVPSHLRLFCLKYGYFRGLIDLYLQSNDTVKAIDLILQTDDLPSFLKIANGVVLDSSLWKHTFVQLQKLDEKDDKEERSITKDIVANQMIISLGVFECLEILKEIPACTEGISHSVYRNFIQKGNIEKQQATLLTDMVENIDSYLWSARPTAIAPQIRYLLDKEIEKAHNLLPYVQTFKNSEKPELKFDQNVPLPRFYEESATHWGVLAPISNRNCAHCSLPVNQQIKNPSTIVIYPCGHSYHEFCIPGFDACVQCLSQNFATVFD